MNKITVQANISAERQKVWDYYTNPVYITKWNFANDDWCCPSASNDLTVGGRYIARMEAKDGSFGFDFDATYTEINKPERFSYEFGGRLATVEFKALQNQTEVTITFDPRQKTLLTFKDKVGKRF
jgi:uncharacterized protein YndB with AHSA1/START domain